MYDRSIEEMIEGWPPTTRLLQWLRRRAAALIKGSKP